jgi:CBS domain-containing protein
MAAVCLALLVGARAAGWPWQLMVFTTLARCGSATPWRSGPSAKSFISLDAWSNPYCWARSSGRLPSSSPSCICRPCGACSTPRPWDRSSSGWSWSPQPRPSSLRARETEHPPAVLKVPPFTCLMALLHRPRSEQATAGRVVCARYREVMTVTATMEEPTTLERLLGTVGEAMTRDVVLLAADMPAAMALRRLDEKAVSGAPVVDRGRIVGVITQRDLLVPTLVDDPAGSPALGVAWHRNRLDGLRVRDLMSGEPVTAERYGRWWGRCGR